MNLYKSLFGRKSDAGEGGVIDMAEHGRVGGLSTGQPFKHTDDVNYAKKITVSGNYTYIATATLGTVDATATWRVFRIDVSVAGDTRFTWCDGDDNFNNVATDLTALTYS